MIKKASVVEIGKIKSKIIKFTNKNNLLSPWMNNIILYLKEGFAVATDSYALYITPIKVEGELYDKVEVPPDIFKKIGHKFIVANYKETEGFLSYEFLSSNGDSYIGKQMKLSYIQQISNIAFLSNDKLHLVLSKDGLKALQELLKIGTRIEIKGFAGIKELEVTTYEDNEKFFIPLDKAAEHDFALYTSFRTMRYLHKCFSMSNGSLYLCVSNDCIYKPIYGIKLDTNSGDLIYCACEGAVERFDEPLYSAMP